MSLKDFAGDNDDNQNNGGGGGIPAGSGGMPVPSGNTGGSDVTDLMIDYNDKFKNAPAAMFRDALIEQTMSILISKNKPNPLLVGSAGVGKTAIVEDLARRVANGDPLVPDQLADHTIYELPITNIIAGCGIVGQLEEQLNEIIDFATDPKNKVILFLDEIHQITGGTSSHSSPELRKISQILKPALGRGDMKVIGATTSGESRAMDDDPAFSRRFARLIVDELTIEQTEDVLRTVRPNLIAHYSHKISVSDDVLHDTVRIADEQRRTDQHRPDNAITLLDRAMADRTIEQKQLIVSAQNSGNTVLVQALQSAPQVPLTDSRVLTVAKRLLTGNAEPPALDIDTVHDELIDKLKGQDDVLEEMVDHLARRDLDLFPTGRPTTWMLAGTSGSGKTESAKIIAQAMTGQDPIILNMSEYTKESEISRIVGAPPGYVGSDSAAELPFDTLESNPYRVILLDEFEKSHRAVQRLFLSAFDEGYITNAHGKQLDFSRSLIIVTTNAARDELSGPSIGFSTGPAKISRKSLNTALASVFDAELLGRFSLIVGFNKLDETDFAEIVASGYAHQRERIVAATPKYNQALPDRIPDDELARIVDQSYIPTQGARPAERAVREWIENHLIDFRRQQQIAVAPATI